MIWNIVGPLVTWGRMDGGGDGVVNRSGRELETSLPMEVRDICHPDMLNR